MIRIVTLLALVAASSALNLDPFGLFSAKPWNSGLSSIFGMNPLEWGKKAFVNLPRSSEEAAKANWVTVEKPNIANGYEDLTLWVNKKEPTTGILVDETGQCAGVQLNLPVDSVDLYYDITEQGFTLWNNDFTGKPTDYYTIRIYFVSSDKETRIKSADKTKTLRQENLVYEGLHGELGMMPANLRNLDKTWTNQSCVPLMGSHKYYAMSKSTSCDKPFLPFFALYDDKVEQLLGIGMMALGRCNNTVPFENPSTDAVKMIVRDGPTCLYELVEKYGACTRHLYLIDNPKIITC